MFSATIAAAAAPPQSAGGNRTITYVNREFGFRFTLPRSWRGYTACIEKHELAGDEAKAHGVSASFRILRISHFLGNAQYPREDIPILIFTPRQWKLVRDQIIPFGAAPFPPYELDHNARYVFALPARFDLEEVVRVIHDKPPHAF